jgi:iron complex outermembrane receptor protein
MKLTMGVKNMRAKSQLMKSAALTATAMAVVLTTPAFAAAEDTPIIVTARRVEERLQDVPISMTVYNQEQITARNITNAADLATYTPSLSVNTRYGPEKASFAIRGFVQDFATAPSVGVYFADVVGPRGSSTTTAGSGVTVGNLFDLQNVQVLKGPQGTLFGRNTTGGAVLLVPNRPTDKLEGYVEGSAGNYDMLRFQGVLNVPLSDTIKVRLGVDRMKRDGYLKNKSPVGPRDFNDSNYISARMSVLIDLTPTLENYTIASYTDSDNNGTTFKVLACDRAGTGGGLSFLGGPFGCAQIDRQAARGDGWWDVENSHPNPRVHFTTWQVINTTTWEASDNITIKNTLSYSEFTEDTDLQLGGDYWDRGDGLPLFSSIQINTTDGFHYGSQSGFTEELQIIGNHGRLNWQTGGFMEISNPLGFNSQSVPLLLNCANPPEQCETGFGFSFPGFFLPIANLGQPFYQQRWRSYGIYAQGTYELTDKLSVTGGIRYTWDKQRHYQSSINIRYLPNVADPANPIRSIFCSNTINNPGPGGLGTTRFFADPFDFHQCDLERSSSSSAPTWVLDLEYKPIPDMLLYAKWSRGYRAGGVNTPFVGYEAWDAEKVDTYEIGAKASFRGTVSGYFNVTGFYNDFTNQQLQSTLTAKLGAPSTGGTTTINAGKSRLWGVEVDTAVTFFDSLRVEVGYAYLNTKLISLTGLPPDDNRVWQAGELPWCCVRPTAIVGESLSFSPKHRLQATVNYTLPLPENIGEITIGGTFVHTASQQSNASTPIGFLRATDLLNLNATWKDVAGQPFDIGFFMTNVTNEKFHLAGGGFFNSFGFDSGPLNEPRMWGFRLKYRFGE